MKKVIEVKIPPGREIAVTISVALKACAVADLATMLTGLRPFDGVELALCGLVMLSWVNGYMIKRWIVNEVMRQVHDNPDVEEEQ